MARFPKKEDVSDETRAEAMKIARATQKPGQTKDQTKLIAQGIQKGIAQYKKQQKARAREQDRLRKRSQPADSHPAADSEPLTPHPAGAGNRLPWLLLLLSWLLFAAYLLLA